ncbi:hypothetical protein [Nonomuraea indica]|uniref:hypothetical protein n=1 Tax=Nonomuraea indica TaxID=1581193 RepID=UPI000C7DF60D|nr:hypothetical protein [Nonomuraea indica]
MSREGVDHALRARAAERDRISGDLLDLESHTTFQVLKDATLSGATRQRWAHAKAALSRLWVLHDAYLAVLRDAERTRALRGRPGADRLAELTALLTGPSVVLPTAVRPVEQRSLLPESDARLTLDEAVLRMDAAFREVTGALSEVDAVWSALLPRLDAADALLRTVTGLRDRLGETIDLTSPADELRDLRAAVVADPLGAAGADGELARVTRVLDDRRADLERALRARDEYGRRREDLLAALDRVRAAESEARLAHGAVVVKISLPPSAAPRSAAGELAGMLDALDVAADGWLSRAVRLSALEGATRDAENRARTTAKALYGLVGRRDELRGRLGACQAMAVRKGRAEDPVAAGLYERARLLLWSAPCDLTRAAEAVELYQRAIHGGGR